MTDIGQAGAAFFDMGPNDQIALLPQSQAGQENINSNGVGLIGFQGQTQNQPAPSGISRTRHATAPQQILHNMQSAAASSLQSRRSSSRSIKRKKFDDELVESSLIKSGSRPKMVPPINIHGTQSSVYSGAYTVPETSPTEVMGMVPIERKKTPKQPSKKMKKSKSPQPIIAKDIGRWKATDDLALILSVQQTNSLKSVYYGVKFSCSFTLQDIQERWYTLLYNSVISKMAVVAMKQLHPEIIAAVQSRVLFSKQEEELLQAIASTSQPTLDVFQDLLNKNPDKFYSSRTAKSLHNHWLLIKQHHLLCDQKVQPAPQEDNILNFSDAEDLLNDNELKEPRDEGLERELSSASRRTKSEVRRLENELPKWQVLVDTVTGVSPPDFDNHTLAVLRGRLVRYLMRSREITIGRATKDSTVDVDLSLEGPAWKISRLQGMIRLRNNGDFFITNEGKRPLYVDGKPVLKGNKYKLNNNSVVEISCLRFIFLVNQDLINIIRAEASKLIT